MNWYKEYQTEWKEIIETVAREVGKSEQMVEKDTIQSMFLFELAKSELPFVFKGGTSLSKAYNLVDRFSEDIDLSMNRRPTQSERVKSKELIIEIAENLGLVLSNSEEIKSRYDYNKYVFKYDSLFSVIPLEIIIETSYYQSVYPADKHVVGSFVGRFCLERSIILPVPFEAAEVMMNVQSIERTFVAESFEPYRSLRERRYLYYRIYVNNFVVYYVVIDDEGDDKIMEVRRFLYNKQEVKRLL